jgi:hypothetical protein
MEEAEDEKLEVGGMETTSEIRISARAASAGDDPATQFVVVGGDDAELGEEDDDYLDVESDFEEIEEMGI